MGLVQYVKNLISPADAVPMTDPRHNPYAEKLLHTITVNIDGEETVLELREIRNKQAQVMGAQAKFKYRGETIPVVISAPQSDTFSAGVSITLPVEIMSEFKEELQRLKDEELVSPGAKLSYNPEAKSAILFRRSEAKIAGNLVRWRDVCDSSLQTLVDDLIACMPYIMKVYGE